MIACGLRELVHDDDRNENNVKVIIYGIAKITNHKLYPFGYMTMDSKKIYGCYFWSLFSSYDQHHMLEDDEKKKLVHTKNNNTRLLK